jgi:hypothetical protein
MEMNKLKTLVAGIALAFSAGGANAALLDGSTGLTTGDGELFVSVHNYTKGLTYHRDLGVTVSGFLASAGDTQSFFSLFSGDTNWTSFLGSLDAGNVVRFNVGGNKNGGTGTPGVGDTVLLTSNEANPVIDAGSYQAVQNAFIDHVNGMNVDYGEPVANNLAQAGINKSAFGDNAALDGYHLEDGWGGQINGAPFASEALFGMDLAMWAFSVNQTGSGRNTVNTPVSQLLAGLWNLSTQGLSYNVETTAPVPVPAAVWLMGSALLGLVGVGARRNREEA